MFDVYINYQPPPPPPPHQKKTVSSSSTRRTHSMAVVARAPSSSDRKSVERDRYIQIIPYDRSRGSDNQRVQKVLENLGGVKSWKVNSDGRLTVSTVQHSETIISALKHEFSPNRRITIVQNTDVSSQQQQDKALQAFGRMVDAHAFQGLIKTIEYKETTTKEGTKTKAIKFNYDPGTSTSSRSAAPASVPRVHNQTYTHPTSRRVRFANAS